VTTQGLPPNLTLLDLSFNLIEEVPQALPRRRAFASITIRSPKLTFLCSKRFIFCR
jgi:hypothetical protein